MPLLRRVPERRDGRKPGRHHESRNHLTPGNACESRNSRKPRNACESRNDRKPTTDPGASEDLCKQNGHTWQYSKVEPTCTSEGYSRRVCTVCGAEETYAVKQKLPHTWETRTEQPTTTRTGRTYRVCTLCGEEETLTTSPVRSAEEQAAYDAMVALKSQYPDGMRWTNSNYYGWKGGIYSGGYGCAGFAFMLSDAAFGSLPSRKVEPVSFSDVRVGDIIRQKGDSHSVIVLEVRTDSVVIAEGNMNSSVLWGRTLEKTDVEEAAYLITRWPQENAAAPNTVTSPVPATTTPVTTTPVTVKPVTAKPVAAKPAAATRGPSGSASNPFTDVAQGAYYYDAVLWALENNITTGVTPTPFNPKGICTSAHVITFLWRANGQPAASGASSLASSYPDQYYTDAISWADSIGLLSGTDSAFIPGQHSPRANIVTYLYNDAAQ